MDCICLNSLFSSYAPSNESADDLVLNEDKEDIVVPETQMDVEISVVPETQMDDLNVVKVSYEKNCCSYFKRMSPSCIFLCL